MSKKSPLQIVKAEHGSKEELAKKVYDLLEKPEDGEEAQELEHRIQTMSNRKLLRLWNSYQVLSSKYGSRQELEEAIVKARFPGGNEDYGRKLASFTVPKLLDVARQHKLVKAAELRQKA